MPSWKIDAARILLCAHLRRLDEVIEIARASGRDHRDGRDRVDCAEQLQVDPAKVPSRSGAREEDLARAEPR